MANAPWSPMARGLRLNLRLTPRGGRDAIDGIEALADGRSVLRCRVRSAPTEGEANAALIQLLARSLAVPKSAITLRAGATARFKTLLIAGDPDLLAQRLTALTTQ